MGVLFDDAAWDNVPSDSNLRQAAASSPDGVRPAQDVVRDDAVAKQLGSTPGMVAASRGEMQQEAKLQTLAQNPAADGFCAVDPDNISMLYGEGPGTLEGINAVAAELKKNDNGGKVSDAAVAGFELGRYDYETLKRTRAFIERGVWTPEELDPYRRYLEERRQGRRVFEYEDVAGVGAGTEQLYRMGARDLPTTAKWATLGLTAGGVLALAAAPFTGGATGPAGVGMLSASAGSMLATGAAAGALYGGFEAARQSEMDSVFQELMITRDDEGQYLDPQVALWAARVYGALSGAVEVSSEAALLGTWGLFGKLGITKGMTAAARKAVLRDAVTRAARDKSFLSVFGDLMMRLGKSAGIEGTEEGLQQILENIITIVGKKYANYTGRNFYAASPQLTWAGITENVWESTYKGGQAGVWLSAIPLLGGTMSRLQSVADARTAAQNHRQLADNLAATANLADSPARAEAYLQAAGVTGNVVVPADALWQLQQEGVDVCGPMGWDQASLEESASMGESMVVPASRLHAAFGRQPDTMHRIADVMHDEGSTVAAMDAEEINDLLDEDIDRHIQEMEEYQQEQDAIEWELERIENELTAAVESVPNLMRQLQAEGTTVKQYVEDQLALAKRYALSMNRRDPANNPIAGTLRKFGIRGLYRDAQGRLLTPEQYDAQLVLNEEEEAQADFWGNLWGRLDSQSFQEAYGRDTYRDFVSRYGRGIFARRGQGVGIDEIADEMVREGRLMPDSDAATLMQVLEGKDAPSSRVRRKINGKRNAVLSANQTVPESSLEAVRQQYQGTAQWMRAPNGKETNLTEQQWLQVRTPEFKAWFGDWENDPENASKVVDENGEPMVMYHMSPNEFDTFRKGTRGGKSGNGIYFARQPRKQFGGVQYACFLNLRNPLTKENAPDGVLEKMGKIVTGVNDKAFDAHPEFDGAMIIPTEVTVREPNQIKSATGNVGTFDAGNPNIYFQVSDIPESSIEAVRRQYEGTEGWLKAPNGKQTNLTERQWLQVRTPEFKNWFGDWENDPENASKVVDENGEPLVLYHGGNNDWSVYDSSRKIETHNTDAIPGHIYMNDRKDVAGTYIEWGKDFPGEEDFLAAVNHDLGSVAMPMDYRIIAPITIGKRKLHLVVDENGKPTGEMFSGGQIIPVDFKMTIRHSKKIAESKLYLAHDFGNTDNTTHWDTTYDTGTANELAFRAKYLDYINHPERAKGAVKALYANVKNPLIVDYEGKHYNDPITVNGEEFGKRGHYADERIASLGELEKFAQKHGYDGVIAHNIVDVGAYRLPAGTAQTATDVIVFAPTNIKSATANAGTFDAGNPNIYFQVSDIPESSIEAVRKQYEGTEGWLKAPNGKQSNLTERQWLQVRTPEFKNWFGDWEADPENASKVVDENGEPLAVFHGGRKVLDFSRGATRGQLGKAYLTDNKLMALQYAMFGGPLAGDYDGRNMTASEIGEAYTEDRAQYNKQPRVTSAFLNIRNPLKIGSTSFEEVIEVIGKDRVAKMVQDDSQLIEQLEDSEQTPLEYLSEDENLLDYLWDTYHGFGYEEWAPIVGNDFYSLFDENGDTDFSAAELFLISSGLFQEYAEKMGIDGVIYHDHEIDARTFVVEKPTQIKSATANAGTFDPANPNILFQTSPGMDTLFQRAFHGSPYRFTQFMLDHIGTGEGGRIHGWGLYFAQNRETSERYRTMVNPSYTYRGKDLLELRNGLEDKGDYARVEIVDDFLLKQNPEEMDWEDYDPEAAKWFKEKVLPQIKSPDSQLYEAEIPEDDVLLDEQKALDEQPEAVHNALFSMLSGDELEDGRKRAAELREKERELKEQGKEDEYLAVGLERINLEARLDGLAKVFDALEKNATGGEIYSALSRLYGSDEAASKALNAAGIKGITYEGGQDGRCFVIFDDQSIQMIDTFYQMMGVQGAEALDRAQEVTTRMDNLNVAREMEAAGKDAKAVKWATGWERGADGLWRYEVGDTRFSKDWLEKKFLPDENGKARIWTDLMDEVLPKDLLEAYPAMEHMVLTVRIEPRAKATGSFMPGTPRTDVYFGTDPEIEIVAPDIKSAESALNHEIQHAIQDIEGFAPGGNLGMFEGQEFDSDRVRQEAEDARLSGDESRADKLESLADEIEENGLNGQIEIDGEFYEDAFAAYEALGGEVEARNVERRMNMTEEERRASLASETEDVPRERQILLGAQQQGASMSMEQDLSDVAAEDRGFMEGALGQRTEDFAMGQTQRTEEGEFVIQLFKSANLSTLAHEFSHAMFLDMHERVQNGTADAQTKADYAALQRWLDDTLSDEAAVKREYDGYVRHNEAFAGRAWEDLSDTEKALAKSVARQELLARGWELYLREGKAPNKQIEGVFRRFAAWLKRVYRDVRQLNVEITDEVRDVFDRMIAADDEMELTAERYAMKDETQRTLDQLGLKGKERLRIEGLIAQAKEEAADKMRAARTRGEREREIKWRKDAKAQALAEPAYKALAGLKKEPMSREALVDRFGEAAVSRLEEAHPEAVKKDGALLPEEAAVKHGYESTEAMLADLTAAPKLKDRIAQLVDEKRAEHDALFDADSYLWEQDQIAKQQEAIAKALERKIAGIIRVQRELRDAKEQADWDAAQAEYNRRADEGRAREKLEREKARGKARAERWKGKYEQAQAEARQARQEEREGRRAYREELSGATQNGVPVQPEAEDWQDFGRLARFRVGQEQLRQAAARHLMGKPLAEATNPELHRRTAAKWINRERRAILKGDWQEAIKANYNARISIELAVQAAKLRDRVAKAGKAAKKLLNAPLKMPYSEKEVVEKHQGMRHAIYLIAKNAGLLAPTQRMENEAAGRTDADVEAALRYLGDLGYLSVATVKDSAGRDVLVCAEVPTATLTDTMDRRAPVGQNMGYLEALETLLFVERADRTVLTKHGRIDFGEYTQDLADRILANNPREGTSSFEKRKKMAELLDKAHAAHLNADAIIELMDDESELLGPIWNALYRPMKEAQDVESDRLAKERKAMRQLFSPYTHKEWMHVISDRVYVDEIGEAITKEQAIAVLLNCGNQGNLDRLLNGGILLKNGAHVTVEQIAAIVGILDARDVQFAQSVWDYLDTFQKESFDLHELMTGVRPRAVEAQAVQTKHGTLRGGYYPIAYDHAKSTTTYDNDEVGTQTAGPWTGVDTGSMQQRSAFGTGGQLNLSVLDVLTGHVEKTVHMLAFRRAVSQVQRTINARNVRAAIDQTAGVAQSKALTDWYKYAAGEEPPSTSYSKLCKWARGSMATFSMGLKLTTMMTQMFGTLWSVNEIGGGWTLYGIGNMIAHPIETWRMAMTYSAMMRQRITSIDREVADFSRRLMETGSTNPFLDLLARGQDKLRSAAFVPMGFCQLVFSDLPVWRGAFGKAVKEGMSQGDAVQYADMAVKRTQGAGDKIDLAKVQRGNELAKLMTMYYSTFSAFYSLSARRLTRFKRTGWKGSAQAWRLATLALLGWFAEPILTGMMTRKDPGDDDDGLFSRFGTLAWWKWAGHEAILNPFGMVVGLRDLVQFLDKSTTRGFGAAFAVTPATRGIDTLGKLVYELSRPANDKSFRPEKAANAAAESFGMLTGLVNQQEIMLLREFFNFLSDEKSFSDALFDAIRRRPKR